MNKLLYTLLLVSPCLFGQVYIPDTSLQPTPETYFIVGNDTIPINTYWYTGNIISEPYHNGWYWKSWEEIEIDRLRKENDSLRSVIKAIKNMK